MEDGVRAIDGFDSFEACSGFAPEGFAVLCLDEDVGTFVNACLLEVEFPEAADVIDDVVKKVGLEDPQGGGVVEAQEGEW